VFCYDGNHGVPAPGINRGGYLGLLCENQLPGCLRGIGLIERTVEPDIENTIAGPIIVVTIDCLVARDRFIVGAGD
jgi:hypothetical protein